MARLNFDADVTEASQVRNALLVIARRAGVIRDDGDHRRVVAGTNAPKVLIDNAVAIDLQSLPHRYTKLPIWNCIQQHYRAVADEPIGPTQDDHRADQTDHRVH